MERRVARAEGHRSKDETEALTARIKGLEAQLQVGPSCCICCAGVAAVVRGSVHTARRLQA